MATPPTPSYTRPAISRSTTSSDPLPLAPPHPRPLSLLASPSFLLPSSRPVPAPSPAQNIPSHSLYPRPRMFEREQSRSSILAAARLRSVSGTSAASQRLEGSSHSSPSRGDYSEDGALLSTSWAVLGGGGSLRRTSGGWYGGLGSPMGRRRTYPSAMSTEEGEGSSFSRFSTAESTGGQRLGREGRIASFDEVEEHTQEGEQSGDAVAQRASEGDRESIRELLGGVGDELETQERRKASRWELSPVARNVLKCVIAYYLAELFSFVPLLAEFVSAPFGDGLITNAHVIATVAVYFNPAKTIGAMIEADLFFFFGVLYAAFLCCGSMATTVVLGSYGHERIAKALVLIVWLGAGLGTLAYMKFRVNRPTMSVACSLVAVITSVIITKEGATHATFESHSIVQIISITLLGTAISNVVCFLLWPTSATEILRGDLDRTLDSFSTLLGLLVDTFLLIDESTPHTPADLSVAIKIHTACFTKLKSTLSQSSYEFSSTNTSATHRSYDDAVGSMTKLAQGLTGMRSGCGMQWELMRAAQEEEEGVHEEEMEIIELFRDKVGDSLMELTAMSRNVLSHLGSSSTKSHSQPHITSSTTLSSLKLDLLRTLNQFKKSHSAALAELYQQLPARSTSGVHDARDPFGEDGEDAREEGADDGPNDTLFRIYYFCFNLEEWVKDLSSLVETFSTLRGEQEELDLINVAQEKTWGILSPVISWFGMGRRLRTRVGRGRKGTSLLRRIGARIATLFSDTSSTDTPSPFPEIVDGAYTSHRSSSDLPLLGRLKQSFWKLGYQLRQPRLKFAVKTGAGVAVLTAPAFLSAGRAFWAEWRGEWALVSFFVISAPTLGGTNFLAGGRILGTLFGALVGVVASTLFPGNSVMLPIVGALISTYPFYIIITRPLYGPSARFFLLTWNLTCLYAYNLRELDAHVISIAVHRSAAVGAGVIWGLIVTSYIWPFEARRELRRGLSEYFTNLAYLYERLVRTYSKPPTKHAKIFRPEVDERAPLLPGSDGQRYEVEDFIAMEVHLQLSLIRLGDLLAATKHEFRLKGPFPVAPYLSVLTSCQNLLDLLTSMRTVTNREAWYTSVRRDFVLPVNPERRDMVGNVLLYFSLLASAMSLKTPLPAYLPPAEKARDRLVSKLRTLPVVRRRIVRGGSEGLLYLAYALTMKDVISQLDTLGGTFQDLFGIIGGGKEEFEALFEDDEYLTEDDYDLSLSSGITQR